MNSSYWLIADGGLYLTQESKVRVDEIVHILVKFSGGGEQWE